MFFHAVIPPHRHADEGSRTSHERFSHLMCGFGTCLAHHQTNFNLNPPKKRRIK
jgi:hypothetical protein